MASLHAQGDGLRVAAEAKADQKLQALTQEAERGGRDIYVATHLPLKRFIFAAKSTLQQGRECFEGNDLQRAYVLLMRFTTFFLERLPEHGEFSKPPAAAERKMLKTECKRVLDDLGPLKAELRSRFAAEEEVRLRAEEEARLQAAEAAAAEAAAARVRASEAARAAQDAEAAEAAAAIAAVEEFENAERARTRTAAVEPMERASEQGGVLASANVCGDCDDEQDDSYPSFDSSLPRLPLGTSQRDEACELLIAERFNQLGTHKGVAAPPPPPPPPPPLPPQYVALGGMFSAHPLAAPPVVPPVGFSNASVPARVSTNGAAATHPYTRTIAVPAAGLHVPADTAGAAIGVSGSLACQQPDHNVPQPQTVIGAPREPNVCASPREQSNAGKSAVGAHRPPAGLASLNMAPMYDPALLPAQATKSGATGCAAGTNIYPTSQAQYATSLNLSMPTPSDAQLGASSCQRVASLAAGAPCAGIVTVPPNAPSAPDTCRCRPPPFSWGATLTSTPPAEAVGTPAAASLRPLHLPQELTSKFLQIAADNTSRNVETCGILAGTIQSGELICDRLIIPSQTGTSDTCTTTDEDEIWEYCSSHGVATFGWIHTHPSQTCFMSSVDLHTHCGYQSMLDEAIAIVLSPRHSPSQGVFRLCHPSPPGLREVQRCRKQGFHPDHQRNGQMAGNGVYEECSHVRWRSNVLMQLVDLRKRR